MRLSLRTEWNTIAPLDACAGSVLGALALKLNFLASLCNISTIFRLRQTDYGKDETIAREEVPGQRLIRALPNSE
jgi:hypothetical protein